jgi:DNA modification methylase
LFDNQIIIPIFVNKSMCEGAHRKPMNVKLNQSVMLKLSQLEANKGQIAGLPKNPRIIKDEKFKKLVKSIEDNPEMTSLREILVFLHDDKYVVIGGNMRLKALKELGYKEAPCKIIPVGTTVEQLKAYTIKDNSGFGEWDFDMLSSDWDLTLLSDCAIDMPEIELPEEEKEVVEDDFSEEEAAQAESRVQRGDIWRLGEHRLMCGDSTDPECVKALMGGQMADMVFTDPPYGMKKEKDGVANDNLNYDDLLEFNKKWIPLTFSSIKDNGSWYCWGIDEPLMDIYTHILKPMKKGSEITIQNYITWDKGVGFGQNSDLMRSYSVATEKCWFVQKGCQGYNTNSDNYFEGFEPIRSYLAGEMEKCGGAKNWKTMLGNGMGSHYFTKSQWAFPTQEAYIKMQRFGNEHDAFKKEWYATRAYFDNTHDNMNDVWHFNKTSQKERKDTGGHATPKPLALCSRGIKSSSKDGELVLDVFGGSGSTLIACEQLGRKCFMMEYEPFYCDVIIARWEKLTGKTAEKIN